MSYDTFAELANRVKLRCPSASPLLCRDWIRNAFRVLQERRIWSWRVATNQFQSKATYSTGTVTVVNGSTSVTGAATAWVNATHAGRQFRIGSGPIYTILSIVDGTQVATLDRVYAGASAAAQSYTLDTRLYTVPTDFASLLSVWNAENNYQLYLNIAQEELNTWDAGRTHQGEPTVVAAHDYDASSPPLPRYELWPHVGSLRTYPYLYVKRLNDLDDSTGFLPRHIPGDVLLDYALSEACAWPGTKEQPNLMSAQWRAEYYMKKFDRRVAELELRDDEIFCRNLLYAPMSFPYGFSQMPGVDWFQTHA